MLFRLLLTAAPFFAALPSAAHPQAVTPQQLFRHIEVLASDEFEGRAPGTPGEDKTLLYISGALQRVGFSPAGEGGGWYQPVPLVERRPFGQRALWSVGGGPAGFGRDDLILVGRSERETLGEAPVVFAGHGGGIDARELAGLRGSVVLMLAEAPKGTEDLASRRKKIAAAGAGAVITIYGSDTPWTAIEGEYAGFRTRLASDEPAPIEGAMPFAAAARLMGDAGGSIDALVAAAAAPAFKPVRLDARASLDVSTRLRRYVSHNVLGRLAGIGAGPGRETVLYLGHWDHVGICRPPGARDRICNGAVDNASGIAVLLEVAARLAAGKRPRRDILVMATTAEEMGLLGARHFAARPVVPLKSIVAAINADTVAIHGAGEPVAVIGRGVAPLDRLIAETAAELGRTIDEDNEADAFVTRQDGWALARVGVPAVMVGGSFSDMRQLGAFLSGPYHQPGDEAGKVRLEGAAEDADLLVALGRKLADPSLYQPPRR